MSTITAKFIEENHPLVKELMLQRQQEQTGIRNWNTFKDVSLFSGFTLANTPEQHGPWADALHHGNFAPLYALHPEWSEPKQEEPAPLVDGEWYWVKQLEDSEWEAGLYFDGHIGESEPFFETRTCIYYVEEIHAIHPQPIKKPE